MRVLVTGAAGFIGSWVSQALIRRGDEVVGVDNFNAYYDPSIKEANIAEVQNEAQSSGSGQFTLIRGDMLEASTLRPLFENPKARPQVICHLAAWAGVRPSIQNPLLYQKTNVEGTLSLLEWARQFEIRPFVFASSSSVYGARTEVPFTEDDAVDDPISPYAATKRAAELMGYTYHHLFGTRFSALRFFTVYGPRQRPEMAIHRFARCVLEGAPITVFGNGQAARDYTFIDDCVQGVVAALDQAYAEDGYRIYNLGNSKTTSLRELVEVIERVTGKKARIQREPDQPGDVPLTCAHIGRAQSLLGYNPQTGMEEGIQKFVAWLRRAR